ncbi:hypothetical protein Tco_1154233 [Tanacetum coccineum]
MEEMMKSSLICLISKASKTKSLLWHRHLSHLNFRTINQLARSSLRFAQIEVCERSLVFSVSNRKAKLDDDDDLGFLIALAWTQGADNRPPMLEKSLYDFWKSRMELYIENQENRRMINNSVQNGPLVWPTVFEEDNTTRTKRYEEFSVAEKLQADCDLKATNIILQGLPPDVYAIVNHHKVSKEICDKVKLLMKGTKLSLQEKECLAVLVFIQGDDLIACLNKAMAFLTAVASSRFPSTNNQLRTSSNLRNHATIQEDRVTM